MSSQRVIYVLICGSRHYESYWHFARTCDTLLSRYVKDGFRIYIVEGGARGADYLAFLYARRRGFKIITHRANWEEFGISAGHIRNKAMVDVANLCIGFWDGVSRGTKSTLALAIGRRIPTRNIKIPGDSGHGKKRSGNGAWREKARRALSEHRKRRRVQAYDCGAQ
ncbi:MAG: DUF2493 domain-containing protein [Gammaproteobacteria bacterium]|nr:DUF2493 domain-containing protein [Gammaproteobacteria bacterium]